MEHQDVAIRKLLDEMRLMEVRGHCDGVKRRRDERCEEPCDETSIFNEGPIFDEEPCADVTSIFDEGPIFDEESSFLRACCVACPAQVPFLPTTAAGRDMGIDSARRVEIRTRVTVACEDWVVDHGVDATTVADMAHLAHDYFTLPPEDKPPLGPYIDTALSPVSFILQLVETEEDEVFHTSPSTCSTMVPNCDVTSSMLTMVEATWSDNEYAPADLQSSCYSSASKANSKLNSLDEVDRELLKTFIPLTEQKRLSNVIIDAVIDSTSLTAERRAERALEARLHLSDLNQAHFNTTLWHAVKSICCFSKSMLRSMQLWGLGVAATVVHPGIPLRHTGDADFVFESYMAMQRFVNFHRRDFNFLDEREFNAASAFVAASSISIPEEAQLRLYSFYKFVTEPSAFKLKELVPIWNADQLKTQSFSQAQLMILNSFWSVVGNQRQVEIY
jgi:hypothetical protein